MNVPIDQEAFKILQSYGMNQYGIGADSAIKRMHRHLDISEIHRNIALDNVENAVEEIRKNPRKFFKEYGNYLNEKYPQDTETWFYYYTKAAEWFDEVY